MTDALMVAGFVSGVLLLGGAGVLWQMPALRRSPEEQEAARERRAQKNALRARQTEAKRVARAQHAQQQAYLCKVAVAEKNLARVQAMPDRKLGRLRGRGMLDGMITLYANRIVTPQGPSYFERGPVTASVEEAGGISYQQRGLAMGVRKGKKHDNRAVYLTVSTPRFVCTMPAQPAYGGAGHARSFAALINTAARSYQTSAQHAAAVRVAQANLAAVRAEAPVFPTPAALAR